MERNAQMFDASLFQQLHGSFIGTAFLIFLKQIFVLGMHEIKIKVVHSADFQLALKQRTNLLLFGKMLGGKLVCQHIAFSGIAGGQAFL